MADVTGSQMVALTDIEVENSPHASVVIVSGVVPALVLVSVLAIACSSPERASGAACHPRARSSIAAWRAAITPEQYREIRALPAASD